MKIPKALIAPLDAYIKIPFIYDTAFMGVFVGGNELIIRYFESCFLLDVDTLGNLLNELVSSSISIGGFVIAALTIILTLKDNLKAKQDSYPISALEILFSSRHYKRLVRVFYWSSFVCVFTFFYFSLLEIVYTNLSPKLFMYLTVYGLILTVLAVVRCLFILLLIIEIQLKGPEFENK